MFIKILLAFLKFAQLHPSVIYKYHETITIITVTTQYNHQKTFAIFIIRFEAFSTKLLLLPELLLLESTDSPTEVHLLLVTEQTSQYMT